MSSYTGGTISPNVLKSPNLTYAISRFLAKIIPVPISPKVPNIAEFFWDLYLKLLCVRHEWRHFQDWISQIYSNQLLFDCVWWSIKFYAFWWFTSFKPIVKLLIKLKNCLTYDVISNAYAFFIFWPKKFIFVPLSPKVPNIAECVNIAEFFCEKTFGDIPPPCNRFQKPKFKRCWH